jgi:hypothetical protein
MLNGNERRGNPSIDGLPIRPGIVARYAKTQNILQRQNLSMLLLCMAQAIKKLKVAHGLCYCMADILLPTEFKDSFGRVGLQQEEPPNKALQPTQLTVTL